MPSARLTLREEDVVRLALEFLHNRELHISQLSLERETGVINGNYSDDVLFLRQLILDGQWDDVLEFIQPLEALQSFEMRKFSYTILKHKYIELLCIKSEANVQGSSVDNAVEEVVKVLNELEKYCPTKEDYSTMCLLLTLPRLTDHLQYKDWNPSNARVQCFREVYPLVAEFLPGDRKSTDANANNSAKNDRLIQLIIKGILYESCVNYCQAKATGSTDTHTQEMSFSRLLDGSVGFSDSDLSLLSWLQSVPPETFSVPFEQRTLNVDVERLERPSLETSWTEHMLVTPIKPKTFPHSAMPFTRPRSAADIMTRSLMPVLDGLPYGLAQTGTAVHNGNPRVMALSTGDIITNSPMSRSSFASFHLTGIKNNKLMNSSVDRLFENEGEVFLSNSYAEFQQLPSIQEQTSTPKLNTPNSLPHSHRNRSKSPERKVSNASTPEHRGRESPASVGTARSSRRDSLNERPAAAQNVAYTPHVDPTLEQSFSGELVKEFQKQKQKLQEALALREKEREELLRQINNDNAKYVEDCKQSANKAVNGTSAPGRNAPSPRPNVNGNEDVYNRVPQNCGEPDPRGLQEGLYDAVKIMASVEERRNISETYLRVNMYTLPLYLPQFDWMRYFQIVLKMKGDFTSPVACYCVIYLTKLFYIISITPARVIQNYVIWRFVRHRTNNMDDRFMEIKQRFYYVLFGREKDPPRWQYCVSQVNANMGMAVGALFVEKYFDRTSRTDTIQMTTNLIKAFRLTLKENSWLDEFTKQYAEMKIDNLDLNIGFPDYILDEKELAKRYSDVEIHPAFFMENTISILKHMTRLELQRFGAAVNRSQWNTPPAVVNAYYSRNKNQIMFPAGILQPPFYHRHFPKALNFGGIGIVIGHEITHGFDDKGRLFDHHGNFHLWWRDSSILKFYEKAQCLIDQYSQYVLPDIKEPLNGYLTQGENIADNGGLKQAYRAYETWLKNNPKADESLPGLNYTARQLFFLNFAQVWCGEQRPEAVKIRLKTSVHAPGIFRVIGVLSNSQEFSKAFSCPVNSPMNPSVKCVVW